MFYYSIRKALFFLSILLIPFFLLSCQTDKGTYSQAPEQKELPQLSFFILPTQSTFPFFYAKWLGLWNKKGLNVKLSTSFSQFDCDTALLQGHFDGGTIDLERLRFYGEKEKKLQIWLVLQESWDIIPTAQLRATSSKQLKGKNIATARFTTEMKLLTEALQTAKIKQDEVFLSQINALNLRAFMILHNQVEATLLPYPWNSYLKQKGLKSLEKGLVKTAFVFNSSTLNKKQSKQLIRFFKEGYNEGLQLLQNPIRPIVDSVLVHYYNFTPAEAKLIATPSFSTSKYIYP